MLLLCHWEKPLEEGKKRSSKGKRLVKGTERHMGLGCVYEREEGWGGGAV